MISGSQDPILKAQVVETRPLPGVRAGSALLALDGRLLAVGDDAFAVTWVDGEVVGDPKPLPKHAKPDFEAAAVAPDGKVWLFGSGSLPQRCQVTCLDGTPAYDARPTYAGLATRLGEPPNVEGAVFVEGRLHLFHRAVGDRPDVWFVLTADRTVDTARELRLGTLRGVPLHLTDVAALPDGRLAFLAAAEETDDPVADGPVSGSVVGVIEGDAARWTPLTVAKAEGLAFVGEDGWFVTDADDPGREAQLCRFTLTPGPA